MATITQMWVIAWNGKSHAIPDDLLVQHDDDWFLKLRPSDHKIVRLLAPGNPKKNSTLSNSTLLQAIKAKRDEALAQTLQPDQGQGIMVNQKKQKAAKQTMDLVVQIEVGGTMVNCLCPKCKTTTDLMIQMNEDQLTAIFQHLEPDTKDITQSPKGKSKKRKVDQLSEFPHDQRD